MKTMTKEEQDKIVSKVKGVLPTVVEFMDRNPHITDFDFGFLYGAGVWECTFFDENDEAVIYLTASNDSELQYKIITYPYSI